MLQSICVLTGNRYKHLCFQIFNVKNEHVRDFGCEYAEEVKRRVWKKNAASTWNLKSLTSVSWVPGILLCTVDGKSTFHTLSLKGLF